VAVVCIGATMVGSIVFTGEEGKTYKKVRHVAVAAATSCLGC
jgi:phosphatidylserine decarboxylase